MEKPTLSPPNASLPLHPKLEILESNSSETLTLAPPPSIHSPPQSPLPPNLPDEHHRLSLLLLLPQNPKPNPNPNPNPNPGSKRKKRPRSSDLQRVSSLSPSQELDARSTFRRARILYESIRAQLAAAVTRSPGSRSRSRSDLDAGTLMNEAGLWLNRDRRTVGLVPGLRAGDLFFYRMELCVLGVHGLPQGGIDFLPARRSPGGEPIATSIVFSCGYEDDEDCGDVILYTGHGGRDGRLRRSNDAKQSVDQKLEGGNLALERCCHYGIEIRVFRGLDCARSPTGRAYVYDGLYRVARRWNEKGKSGFAVCKFELVRLQGQEEMGSVLMKLAEDLQKDPMAARPDGYLSLDISKGDENEPVTVFNDVDCNRDPLICDYLVRPEFSFFVKRPGGRGCQCGSDCSVGCACAGRNGGEFAYDCDGKLLRGKPLVYECGRYCGCPPSCGNRLSQKGLRHRLEVFRSRDGRWAVRSLDVIQAGEFVCEYSGIPLTKQQGELAAENGALVMDPNRLPRRWEEWGDLSMVTSDYERPELASLPEVSYLIDVSRGRNVACYISHGCNPNVFVQFVLADHYNVSYPLLMIFAMEHIPPMRELSLDYGVGAV